VYSKRDGKKIRKQFATHAEAVAWRNDAASAVQKRLLRAPASTTVQQAWDVSVEQAEQGVIRTREGDPYKPSAIRGYRQAMRLRVVPEIGTARLSVVSRNDLQDLVDRLLGEGLSASTINATLVPLRTIYRRALLRGDVAVNPTTGLQLPAVRGKRDRIADPAECERLLNALAADRALWATLMYAGLRVGEARALHVEDVNLATGLIHVRRGWDPKEGEQSTKTGKDRKVPIASVLRDYLDEHMLLLGRAEGLMFGVTAVDPFPLSTFSVRAKTRWAKAKLATITPHECRHTYASLMIAAGVNPKALSTYMGHANIAITMDRYGHLMPGNESEAAGLLDAYLARATNTTGADTGAHPAQTQKLPANRY
jgi:integrase